MLTILAALNDEVKLIRAEMEIDKVIHIKPLTISTGKYEDHRITLIKTGVGREAMRNAITYCVENQKPALLVNIGYAGGLDPHLHAGDIVIADSLVDEPTEKSWKPDDGLVKRSASIAESCDIRHRVGRIVTVEKSINTPHQKAFIGTRFEAIACDMESAIFAEVAIGAGIPFIVARSILDPLDTVLPEIPKEAVPDGETCIGPLLSHFKTRPKDLLMLPRYSYLANLARISMTNFIKGLIAKW